MKYSEFRAFRKGTTYRNEYFIENDGIGSYEWHGQRCFDKGHDYVSGTVFVVMPITMSQADVYELSKRFADHFIDRAKLLAYGIDVRMNETTYVYRHSICVDYIASVPECDRRECDCEEGAYV